MKGRIRKYIEERGFGFVTPDDGGPTISFHINSSPNLVPEQTAITIATAR
jgi:cold shock CspA family protein